MMIDEKLDNLYLSKIAEKTRDAINSALKQAICLILG